MKKKIGETFEYEGKTFRVKEDENYGCHGCFFYKRCTLSVIKMVGQCDPDCRTDGKSVIFVEVQEHQTGEHEAVKEQKVGEVFEFEGHKLKVVDEGTCKCNECLFYRRECSLIRNVIGSCSEVHRTDKKSVIFVKVKDGQPQEQAEQPQLNLCEILKNCPEGTELWSDNYGIVKFVNVGTEWDTPIRVKLTNGFIASYTEEGWCDKRFPASCLLWPSKDFRDWSKFTAPWLKKERFDPKTLSPFDRVLARNHGSHRWTCDLFSDIIDGNECMYHCIGSYYRYCIPYNDDTKHLVDTKDEAPVFYRYWED